MELVVRFSENPIVVLVERDRRIVVDGRGAGDDVDRVSARCPLSIGRFTSLLALSIVASRRSVTGLSDGSPDRVVGLSTFTVPGWLFCPAPSHHASMQSTQAPIDLGVLQGHEEYRGQSGDFHVKLTLGGPYRVADDEPVLTIDQTVLYPAKQDREVQTELPLYRAKQLHAELGDRIERLEALSGGD